MAPTERLILLRRPTKKHNFEVVSFFNWIEEVRTSHGVCRMFCSPSSRSAHSAKFGKIRSRCSKLSWLSRTCFINIQIYRRVVLAASLKYPPKNLRNCGTANQVCKEKSSISFYMLYFGFL
ncbi:hypothetical protein Plhal304r1_c027g0089951 [Plasmopara halstedii]